MTRNQFPPHYAEAITETNLPAELIPQYATCEYELQTVPPAGSPCFLFVVDTCGGRAAAEELAELADSLQQALHLLPPDALVGFISYGTNVSVYELASEAIAKSYIFRGNREYGPVGVLSFACCRVICIIIGNKLKSDVFVCSCSRDVLPSCLGVSDRRRSTLKEDQEDRHPILVAALHKKFFRDFCYQSRNVPTFWKAFWMIFVVTLGRCLAISAPLAPRAVPCL